MGISKLDVQGDEFLAECIVVQQLLRVPPFARWVNFELVSQDGDQMSQRGYCKWVVGEEHRQ